MTAAPDDTLAKLRDQVEMLEWERDALTRARDALAAQLADLDARYRALQKSHLAAQAATAGQIRR